MMSDVDPASIAIVGAGPGGLASAMLLAKAGYRVDLYEARAQLGGRSSTIRGASAAGEFKFDMGPTFFLYPRVLADIFAACGRKLEEEVDMIRLDPQYRLAFEDGGRIEATGDMARMQAEIERLSPEDGRALPRFMRDNRRKLAAFRPVMETAFNSVRDLMRPAVLRGLSQLRPHRTVDEDLSTYFKDERIRLAFSFQSKYLGMSPFRCPSMFTMLSFLEYEYGVFHPRGGTGAVMEAMARVATSLGVRIHVNEPVQRFLFEGRRAVGLVTPRLETRFDAVVINSDFAHTMTKLVPDALRNRWKDRRIKRKKFSCSTFMMYLGIEGAIPDLAHHTIYLVKDYRRNIAAIEAGLAPAEPSFYVQNACVSDATLAPSGHSTLYVLVPVGNRQRDGVDWRIEASHYRALVLQRLERIGITNIEARIRYEKIMTPADWESDMHIYRGATFNLAHNLGQMLHRRPHNRFEDLENVYLVGGGTHPGSGLPVIFESARITARVLEQDLSRRPQRAASTPGAMHELATVRGEAS
jgi:phytoene desaturase